MNVISPTRTVVRLGRRALPDWRLRLAAAGAFTGIFVFHIPFPLVVLIAGVIGALALRPPASGEAPDAEADSDGSVLRLPARGPSSTLPASAWLAALWLAPVAGLTALAGDSVFADIAVFFSKMAVVTFGGAYAVLAYVAQSAVETYGWLRPGEMLDGLALAETTPGPLIMVTQFVGFMGGFRAPGDLPPLLAGVIGGLLTTWVTFTPCFLWIFLGAPHVEALRRAVVLNAALRAITAAVVGVILNLAIWFGLHVIFTRTFEVRAAGVRLDVPDPASVDLLALALAAVATLAVLRFRVGVLPVLAACAAAGIAAQAIGLR